MEQKSERVQEPGLAVNKMNGGDSVMSSASKGAERRSEEACKSHKESERRRRQRINAHLSTLRSLLPNTTKVFVFVLPLFLTFAFSLHPLAVIWIVS